MADSPAKAIFPGFSEGPAEFGQTLAWYDGPLVFTAKHPEGRGWLCVVTGDDRENRTQDFMLFPLEAGELETVHQKLKEETPVGHNGVAVRSLQRVKFATLLHCSWDGDWRVLREKRVDPPEATEAAIGED